MPALPALPSGATVVATGTLAFTLRPGEARVFDASVAPSPPSCPSLVWVAAWRATDPLTGTVVLSTGGRLDIGAGRWGTADMGCATLELRNLGAATVSGELGYAVASR